MKLDLCLACLVHAVVAVSGLSMRLQNHAKNPDLVPASKMKLDCCLVHENVALRGPFMSLQGQAKQPRVCASFQNEA